MDYTFDAVSKKSLPYPSLSRFPSLLSHRSYIFCGFHLGFILVNFCEKCKISVQIYFSLPADVQLSSKYILSSAEYIAVFAVT